MKSNSGSGGLVMGMLAGAVALAAVGALLVLRGGEGKPILGAALLAGGVVGAFVALLAKVVAGQLEAAAAEASRQRTSAAAMEAARMDSFLAGLREAAATQPMISERAKEIAFRDRDLEIVRHAVREEVERGNWTRAEQLIERMEETFGDPLGAEQLRTELSGLRMGAIRREYEKVKEMVARYAGIEDWKNAVREAKSFTERYPELEEARGLPAEVERRRLAVKQHLLERWREIVASRDDEAMMPVLRKLDGLLTPEEAEGMAEDARTLLAERRAKLRDQFTSLVAGQEWEKAIRLGELIQAEFPNSKLANEIRASMDELRERAAGGGTEMFKEG